MEVPLLWRCHGGAIAPVLPSSYQDILPTGTEILSPGILSYLYWDFVPWDFVLRDVVPWDSVRTPMFPYPAAPPTLTAFGMSGPTLGNNNK